MRRRSIRNLFVLCLVAIVCLVAIRYWLRPKASVFRLATVPSPTPAISSVSPSPFASTKPSAHPPIDVTAVHDAEVKREQGIVNLWIMTPITFYGKVVDEKGNPVDGAKIIMSPAQHPYGNDPEYERISDANGCFSISAIHGAELQVHASKEGYYSLPQSWGDFSYAGPRGGNQNPAHPDSTDPAVFVLRKMGTTEKLIVQDRNIKISKTGDAASMDLRTGSTSGVHSPDVQVQVWINDQYVTHGVGGHAQRFDWKCVVTAPGGGLQVRNGGEFDFEAPPDGYQPSDEIAESGIDQGWKGSFSREYFVKLSSGEYARINLTLHAGGNLFFHITSYLNPTPGHRILEYNPNQQPPAP